MQARDAKLASHVVRALHLAPTGGRRRTSSRSPTAPGRSDSSSRSEIDARRARRRARASPRGRSAGAEVDLSPARTDGGLVRHAYFIPCRSSAERATRIGELRRAVIDARRPLVPVEVRQRREVGHAQGAMGLGARSSTRPRTRAVWNLIIDTSSRRAGPSRSIFQAACRTSSVAAEISARLSAIHACTS